MVHIEGNKMTKKVLLVEPMFYRSIVPFAIMKLSSYYKANGYEVKYVRTNNLTMYKDYEPDEVGITSIFTWDLDKVCECINSAKKVFPNALIKVGGVAVTKMPEYIKEKTGIEPHIGLIPEVEKFSPDYSIFPDIDYSLTFTTRGCVRKCGFCVVSSHEPVYIERENWVDDINIKSKRIIVMDNNLLACSKEHFDNVIDKLIDFGKEVDLNQGLDAILLTDYQARRLNELKIKPFRFAFDQRYYEKDVRKANELITKYGANSKNIHYFILYNWNDTMQDAHERAAIIQNELNAIPYAMRYCPLDSLTKNTYIGKHWNKEDAEKFRMYWNFQRISKSCTYEEFKNGSYKKFIEEHKNDVKIKKGQKKLW